VKYKEEVLTDQSVGLDGDGGTSRVEAVGNNVDTTRSQLFVAMQSRAIKSFVNFIIDSPHRTTL
jgi:hypothetical protein